MAGAGVGVGVGVGEGVALGVGVGVGLGVGEAVGDGVSVGEGLGEGVGLGVADGKIVGEGLGDGRGEVGSGDGEGVSVEVGDGEVVGDGVDVGLGIGVGVGVALWCFAKAIGATHEVKIIQKSMAHHGFTLFIPARISEGIKPRASAKTPSRFLSRSLSILSLERPLTIRVLGDFGLDLAITVPGLVVVVVEALDQRILF